jgi:hypothetical protein
MADCELIEKCIFFNDKMQGMPTTANNMKRRYCQGDSEICARHMVFASLGREKVPADLFPSNVERAQQILSNK